MRAEYLLYLEVLPEEAGIFGIADKPGVTIPLFYNARLLPDPNGF